MNKRKPPEEEIRKGDEAFSSLLMSISRPQQLGRDPLKASLVVDLSSADLRLSFFILFYDAHDFNPSGPAAG